MAPTFRAGRGQYLTISSATGGTINFSSGLDNCSLERSAADLVVTTFGDADAVRLPGTLKDASFTASGHFASTYEAKLAAMLGHTTLLSWVYGPESTDNTRRKISGSCVLTNYTVGGSVDGKVDMSIAASNSGTITATTF